ncbi:CPBP family glutamic-type intramembrane protease [Paracoccus sp. MBLB3053]|uniref:CPBP family glutamic-type intramembrane protease n=1 Tax=Paracoccus aurantius TaxID=3073814 RepID=A0ABU2HQ52_9RHOB|nr:CPBP family glutamic-type intramembrane protease [Paracoccus sp. MBLB3053]MDS9467166.1 CPBP family glutamic-type intramembrane protease [Paracoccus sp. MBLB3053]
MDRRLGLVAGMTIPFLALLFWVLTRSFSPVTGYFLGLCIYWMLLAVGILLHPRWSMKPRWPAHWAVLAFALLIGLAFFATSRHMSVLSPHVAFLVLCSALLNGTLEEAFWRGALVPDLGAGDWRRALMPLGLFTLWHIAPAAGVRDLSLPGGSMGMLVAAAIFGVAAMAARLSSGTAGASAIGHVLVNLSTFWAIASHP